MNAQYINNNLVSVITPLYNKEKYIANTIESVLVQSYENWEMLIVDECSFDNGPNIVKKYVQKDNRIKYFLQDKKMGASEARNKALREARGRYMAFLDGDDLWSEDKLEIRIDFMKKMIYILVIQTMNHLMKKLLNTSLLQIVLHTSPC